MLASAFRTISTLSVIRRQCSEFRIITAKLYELRTRRFASSSIWFVHVRLPTPALGTPHRSKPGIRYWVRNPMQRLVCASLPFRITTGRVRVDLDRDTKRPRTRGGEVGVQREVWQASDRRPGSVARQYPCLPSYPPTSMSLDRPPELSLLFCWPTGYPGLPYPSPLSLAVFVVCSQATLRHTLHRLHPYCIRSRRQWCHTFPTSSRSYLRSIEPVPRRKQGATTEPFTPAI
jgi:hypothetical protein